VIRILGGFDDCPCTMPLPWSAGEAAASPADLL
jgi:hypothetical protein